MEIGTGREMWCLEDQHASLETAGLCAHVDLDNPQRGVDRIRIDGADYAEISLLGPVIRTPPEKRSTPADAYVRSNDLIAVYESNVEQTLRQQIYWRAIQTSNAPAVNGLELVVSAQTSSLDSTPAMELVTRLAAAEVLWREKKDSSFATLDISVQADLENPTIVLFRLPGSEWSYSEFIHPSDFESSKLSVEDRHAGSILLRYKLFAEHLEKGVIRRGRARGVFVPRANDQLAARTCYDEFVSSRPPLEA